MQHTAGHEALLEQVLADPDATTHDARSTLEACPTCRATLDRMRGLGDRLTAAAALEREMIAAARHTDEGHGERAALSFARRHLGRAAGRSRRRGAWLVTAALAAAAVVVALLVLRGGGTPAVAPGPTWLDATQRDMTPSGEVEAGYGMFRWPRAGESGVTYHLRIRAIAADGERPLICEKRNLETNEWSPEDHGFVLPDRIQWEVVPVSATGFSYAPRSALASRKRR